MGGGGRLTIETAEARPRRGLMRMMRGGQLAPVDDGRVGRAAALDRDLDAVAIAAERRGDVGRAADSITVDRGDHVARLQAEARAERASVDAGDPEPLGVIADLDAEPRLAAVKEVAAAARAAAVVGDPATEAGERVFAEARPG